MWIFIYVNLYVYGELNKTLSNTNTMSKAQNQQKSNNKKKEKTGAKPSNGHEAEGGSLLFLLTFKSKFCLF